MNIELTKFLDTAAEPVDTEATRVYFASPYTHEDPKVMEARVAEITRITAAYMQRYPDHVVYSPVVSTHPLSAHCTPPRSWYREGLKELAISDMLKVVKMDNWDESRGILLEIGFALGKGIPIEFVDPDALFENAPPETEGVPDGITEAEIARQMDEMLKWNEDQYGNMSETELRQRAIGILEDDVPF